MKFSEFAVFLQKIEATPKRLEMTKTLAVVFQELDQEEIQSACYLLQGKVVPVYIAQEFQMSTKMMLRVLDQIQSSKTNELELDGDAKLSDLSERYKKVGDIGVFAEEILSTLPAVTTSLSVLEIFTQLVQITKEGGAGSQARKIELTVQLFQSIDALSARYISRMIVGNMRLGFSDMTMIDALSWSLVGDKSLSSQIELAYQKQADIGVIAKELRSKGIGGLDHISVRVGTPVIPALCQRLNTAQEIIEKMSTVYAEPKYDGTRVQIHFKRQSNGSSIIRTYTRNLEESSHMFPELQELEKILTCDSCILDSEAIGYDPKTDSLLPFQQTIQRKRKHGVEETAKSIPLRFFIFDVLAVNDESCLDLPLLERKLKLKQLFTSDQTFVHSPYIETSDPVTLHNYHEQQLLEGLEGVVIKKVDAVYQSGRKGYSWVKIKEAEGVRGKLSDTVDAVVMGYFYGSGKRTQFGMGAALVGVLNEQGEIVTISKVGSGFTEATTQEFVQRVKDLVREEKPSVYQVNKLLLPDVWVDPGLVIEIAADELTQSPSHTSGVALRFPRIIRFRDDKKWDQATTLEELKKFTI